MKLLDKIKELVLPYGDQTSADKRHIEEDRKEAAQAQATQEEVKVNIAVNDPTHADQEELNAHINQTIVSLTPKEGGEAIPLEQNSEDELSSTFEAQNITTGDYTLSAVLTTSDGANYEASEAITVGEEENNFNLTLTKTEVSG